MSNHLTSWKEFCDLGSKANVKAMGFAGTIGDVNRFSARYRAAKSFKGVILEDYTHDTVAGYSALCRVLFVWSAFESFLRILGMKQQQLVPLLEQHGVADVVAHIHDIDEGEKFYAFIHERANSKLQGALEAFHRQESLNVTFVASAIRHIFAHGHLTPNVNKVKPEVASLICDVLSDYLLKVMDDEFSQRVATIRK